MTTSELVNNAAPSMFNIQYPNCTRGMFSLREPFKNMPPPITPADIEPNPGWYYSFILEFMYLFIHI